MWRTKAIIFEQPMTGEADMDGIDPFAYLQQVARRMGQLTDRREIEIVLDEVEYLFDALDPEFQDPASQLIEQLRAKLERAV
jgi:hypothetical protein